MRFDERIGGVLVAPRRTFARLVGGEARASDVAWLLVLRLVAGELDRFVRAFAVARDIGVGFAAQEVLAISATVLPDVVGILAAGMLLQLFARQKNAFDVAAYAWVPYLVVQVAGALYNTARAVAPSPRARDLLEAAGVAWALATWLVALMAARRAPVDHDASPPTVTA